MAGPWEKYQSKPKDGPWTKYAQIESPNTDGTYGQPPEGMFINPQTGQMTSRELLRGNVAANPAEAAAAGYMQGYALSSVDEAAGAAGYLEGGPEMANFRREQARAGFEGAQEQHPALYTAGRIVGAITNPVTRMFPATTVPGAAVAAGTEGALDSFGNSEGGFKERITDSAKGGAISFITGGATAGLLKGLSRGKQALFNRGQTRPSVGTLQQFKNSAYADVRKSGFRFSEDDMTAQLQRLQRKAKTSRWDLDEVSEVDKPAFDAMRVLERRIGLNRPVSLDMLDKTRQKLWDIYNRTDHPFVLEAIGEIDETISRAAGANEVMEVARLANSRFAKAQLLENAFHKAQLQTASTGSGGNILNKYRQAVTRIITTPREAKWFSPEELELMEQFVMGNNAENALRRIGKLSPGGNGLMTALNVYAASVNPAMLGITGAATAAKGAADKSAMRGSERILDAVSGFEKATPPSSSLRGPAVGGATAVRERFR